MSRSSNSPAPKSNESAKQHSPSNADFLYEQSAVSSESNESAGSSPPSSPPSPPASSPSSQPPPPPKSQSPPPSSPPPPPQSSPPPKPSPPPPPKSSPSPPPSSPPPSSPPSSPPPSPPPSKSPPAPPPHPPPPRSPPPKSSSPPPPSPSGASPPKAATPTSPPSENESDAKPPAPSNGEASQSNPAPETPVSPPAAPGTPVPLTPNPNPNPATPAVPTPPKEATNSTSKTPVASGPPPNLLSAATNTTAAAGDSSSSGHTGTVIGLTVAGVFLVALIAVVFLFVRRKRKHQPYPPNYMPPPPGAANKSEGYYPGQGPNSGPAESYYSNGPFPQSSFENSYGSQRERNGGISGGGGGSDSGLITGTKVHFSYEELMDITNGFSRQNVLGEGGFGCVYKGWMLDGKVVAVKQLKAGSGQGEKEFRAEVEIITRVHHRHLVSLVGYCISEQQRLLIYEFVPNKTLEHHLHSPGMPVLEWTKRLKIALGSAKGLAYLHEDCHPKIIHRDIKSANILLDDFFEAQVADFGLAKLTNDMNTHVSTRVMGTFGYMAPEYASSGKLTDRSDVFSFGVVLLELITGRKPVDPTQPLGDESLVEWARPLLIKSLESGDLSELVDPRLEKHYVEGEMLRMVQAAAACVRHSATKRPRMAQVCRSLDCEGELSDLSNGVKFGQSTAYDSGQYNEDIVKFRRMALGSGGSSEFEVSSSEFNPASRELSGPQSSWTTARPDVSSDESETRAFNNQGSASKNQRNNSVRRF